MKPIPIVAGLALVAIGCAAAGPRFAVEKAPANEAVIYVYRPYHFFGFAIRPSVRCDDQSSAIAAGAYHAFVVHPGHVICGIETASGKDEIDIDAEPRNYYVREEIALGWIVGWPKLSPIDQDQAQSEIQGCCVQQQ
jgi:hypothetical protein